MYSFPINIAAILANFDRGGLGLGCVCVCLQSFNFLMLEFFCLYKIFGTIAFKFRILRMFWSKGVVVAVKLGVENCTCSNVQLYCNAEGCTLGYSKLWFTPNTVPWLVSCVPRLCSDWWMKLCLGWKSWGKLGTCQVCVFDSPCACCCS